VTAPTSLRNARTDGCRSILLLTLSVAGLLHGCGQPERDVEAEIALLVDTAQASVEAGDAGSVIDILSQDYADAEGRNRRAMAFLVRTQLGRYQRLKTLVTDLSVVAISDQLATAGMTVSLIGSDSRRPAWTGIDADRVRLELALRREDGRWYVSGARWGPPGTIPH
jgi:hypothetical protein